MPPFIRTALSPAGTGRPRIGPYVGQGSGGRALALSFTVPCAPRSAAIVRGAMACALRVHGLDCFEAPALLVATELVAAATKLAARSKPGAFGREGLYLSLRHRDDALRVVVWDQHPRHADPDAVLLCEDRRRRSLWLLAAVVEDWGGDWGICGAALRPQPEPEPEPSHHHAIKSWVVLPR